MSIIASLWHWPFPAQPCVACHQPCDIAACDADVDAQGKLIGWRHAECDRG
jgi:hypothetical protein